MSAPPRLYGLPDAEILHDSPDAVLETYVDDYLGETPAWENLKIQVWTVRPARSHLPSAPTVVEYLEEWLADMGELTDFVFEHYADKVDDHEAEIEAVLQKIADSVASGMADRHVKTVHATIHIEDDGAYRIVEWIEVAR